MATPTLELFFKPTCPYCHKVLSFMKDHNIELPLYDIDSDEAARNRLIEVGGKRQVPCLFIDGAAMYESNDIIAYLSKTFDVDRVDSSEKNDAAPAGGSCTIGGGCSF